MSIAEIIGYAASFVVLISFLTTSVVKLRIINFFGCLLFVIYGIFISAYPVAVMNTIIMLIQVYFLYKMFRVQADYRLVKCASSDLFVIDFIERHLPDINKFLPDFKALPENSQCYICMVNEELAGIWGAVKVGNTLDVCLEYVKDKFRDCEMGRYIYTKNIEFFHQGGIKSFEANGIFGKHADYLQTIGFKKTKTEGKYILDI